MQLEEIHPSSFRCLEGSNFIGLSGHRIVCDPEGDGIYLVGGWNPTYNDSNAEGGFDNHYVRRVWKFSMATKIWTQLRSDDPPGSLASHCLANLGRRTIDGSSTSTPTSTYLLMFGGSLSYRNVAGNSNKSYLYNAGNERWEELTTSGHPPAEENSHWFGQAMTKHGENIYVATGRSFQSWNETEIHRLNLRTLVWEALSVHKRGAPVCRVRHEIVVDDDEEKVYVFGGGVDFMGDCFDLENIPYFDIRSNCWRELRTQPNPDGDYPFGRSCFGCVKFGDYVYIVGGYSMLVEDAWYSPMDDLWRLHLPTGQWSMLMFPLPTLLWFHSVDVDRDGVMYIFGGVTDTHYSSDRSSQLWRIGLVVPPLKRLAWEKVLNITDGKLVTFSDQELVDRLHLAPEFVAKLKW